MLVVADSSPVLYLVLIGQADVLPALFSQVFVPRAVARELTHRNAPSAVQRFLADGPEWLKVQDPQQVDPIPGIDLGEQAAISLARELGADLLLIDAIRRLAGASTTGPCWRPMRWNGPFLRLTGTSWRGSRRLHYLAETQPLGHRPRRRCRKRSYLP